MTCSSAANPASSGLRLLGTIALALFLASVVALRRRLAPQR